MCVLFHRTTKLRVTTHVCTGTEVEQGRQKGFETQQPRYQARSERRHVRLGRDGWSDWLSAGVANVFVHIYIYIFQTVLHTIMYMRAISSIPPVVSKVFLSKYSTNQTTKVSLICVKDCLFISFKTRELFSLFHFFSLLFCRLLGRSES